MWLLPEPAVRFRLDRVIHQLASRLNTPVFTPHLTIAGVPEENLMTAGSNLTELTSEIKPFSLSVLDRVSSPKPYQKLVLRLQGDSYFLNFISAIGAKLKLDVKTENPHVSLLYGNIQDELLDKIQGLIFSELPSEILFDSLALVELAGSPSNWKILNTQKLSAS